MATLAALEYTLPQIALELHTTPVRVRNAVVRLRRVAPQLHFTEEMMQ